MTARACRRHEGGDRLTIEKGRTNNITAIYCG